jgi:hypothetical protein
MVLSRLKTGQVHLIVLGGKTLNDGMFRQLLYFASNGE